ncbi:hypothetical protein BC1002_3004 [Paraburkholderia atlantica]|uniref:DNA-binding protein n=1 Tax=Paraburkholderia atlantica TaxID=2654982 RepID=D5W6C8_PARAM|nr:hypothetical protein [Paraburkholderia atlantica]ADG17049.1 hypothetical protein BC1002_3004 [Paraburkholderia atlantica]
MTDLDAGLAARIAATARQIERYCRRNEIAVAADGGIDEAAAAKVLGYAGPDALRRQAAEGVNRVPFRLLGNRRLYRILDLAREIERSYNGDG